MYGTGLATGAGVAALAVLRGTGVADAARGMLATGTGVAEAVGTGLATGAIEAAVAAGVGVAGACAAGRALPCWPDVVAAAALQPVISARPASPAIMTLACGRFAGNSM
ncbi:MAG: hypothetical protein ACRDN0_02275 [Trebonia sp.]